jgi:hypothetical protein
MPAPVNRPRLQDSALPDRLRVWEALDLFASFGRRARDKARSPFGGDGGVGGQPADGGEGQAGE